MATFPPKDSVQSQVHETDPQASHSSFPVDSDAFLQKELIGSDSARTARKPSSTPAILQAIIDTLMALTALWFIAFGVLICRNDGRPLDDDGLSTKLLSAAHYVRTH